MRSSVIFHFARRFQNWRFDAPYKMKKPLLMPAMAFLFVGVSRFELPTPRPPDANFTPLNCSNYL
jgi:hypothetical protein